MMAMALACWCGGARGVDQERGSATDCLWEESCIFCSMMAALHIIGYGKTVTLANIELKSGGCDDQEL